jgi:exopolyphosphatase/guanosine-5'-triphosphate,3'-diphosphate pyrophosphatase
VRRACIDIGSNTTRLLVADSDDVSLREVHQERVFTRIARGHLTGGGISEAKVAELADVVADQLRVARALGATEVIALATAAIRRASNRDELSEAVRTRCGLEITVLTEEEEARLAFVGAARALGRSPDGALGVVDVGGGSSELIVGRVPNAVDWSRSVAVGSGDLADVFLHSDPPSPSELGRARQHVVQAFLDVAIPRTCLAVAVGGSATSLRRLAGERLDEEALERSLLLLGTTTATDVARRFGLDRERVRLLPGGLLILQAAAERFDAALRIGHGGLREGALLEAAR